MTSKNEIRPIRFYCPECGKELWEMVDYNDIANDTIGQILITLLCSDCLLLKLKEGDSV